MPLPATEISIREDDRELQVGEEGELCVRGPQVMRGYWNAPGETGNVLDAEGWLRTGDIARVDQDGFLKIVDRKKDMIIVGGRNVYPQDLEALTYEVPGVHAGRSVAFGMFNEEEGTEDVVIIAEVD